MKRMLVGALSLFAAWSVLQAGPLVRTHHPLPDAVKVQPAPPPTTIARPFTQEQLGRLKLPNDTERLAEFSALLVAANVPVAQHAPRTQQFKALPPELQQSALLASRDRQAAGAIGYMEVVNWRTLKPASPGAPPATVRILDAGVWPTPGKMEGDAVVVVPGNFGWIEGTGLTSGTPVFLDPRPGLPGAVATWLVDFVPFLPKRLAFAIPADTYRPGGHHIATQADGDHFRYLSLEPRGCLIGAVATAIAIPLAIQRGGHPTPPLVKDDFESYPVGARPAPGQFRVEGKGDSLAVSSVTAAGGRQSLKFADASGLQQVSTPALSYSPDYAQSSAHCDFDVRLEAGARLRLECQDISVRPVTTGPKLTIVNSKLAVNGVQLMTVPVGQWFHMSLVVGLGWEATGTWNLLVTLPGQPPKLFEEMPVVTAAWAKLTSIGFASDATTPTVIYLDNLEIKTDLWVDDDAK